jgi:hypothetical protein
MAYGKNWHMAYGVWQKVLGDYWLAQRVSEALDLASD